jgi:hypothetical protein
MSILLPSSAAFQQATRLGARGRIALHRLPVRIASHALRAALTPEDASCRRLHLQNGR